MNLLARGVARVRLPAQLAGIVLIVVAVVVDRVTEGYDALTTVAVVVGLACVAVALIGTLVGPPLGGAPLELGSPVRGRWEALNSPASKTPSHGTHAYGQTYAVDLVHAPDGVDRPRFGATGVLGFLPPGRFPGFGQPVLSPADAVVVRAVDRMRDHRSRSSWLAYALFFLEAIPRELLGPVGVVGNHVVLRFEDGSHFVLAHLRRGSVRVHTGDRVREGDEIGRCGNSGNTTEPHLHCHRQDTASVFLAGGLPWTIRGTGIPPNGEALEA